jgi:DNA-binding transcriptional MerR regulator
MALQVQTYDIVHASRIPTPPGVDVLLHRTPQDPEPMTRPARFTIRSVSALTGVNPNTLRAWERRYGLLCPERTPSGYRMYTQADIDRLRMVQDLLNRGVPAGQVVQHLQTLEGGSSEAGAVAPVPSEPGPARARGPRTPEDFARSIARAARSRDLVAEQRLFNRAIGLFTVERAFPEVLLAALRMLEDEAARGDLIAREAATRLADDARRRLQAVLAGLKPLHQRPAVVCAHTGSARAEGELMNVALELGLARVSVQYVVAKDHPEAVGQAAAQDSVRTVVMTSANGEGHERVREAMSQATRRLRPDAVHVIKAQDASDIEWVNTTGARVLEGDSRAKAGVLLKALGWS